MINYKLLTPGPLTTTESVKNAMLIDHCTWDTDYKQITQRIRRKLLEIANVSEENYTAILMQGSGTFGVESVLTSAIGKKDKLLIVANGAYGERMELIAQHAGLNYKILKFKYNEIPDLQKIDDELAEDTSITHVSMVHCETTSGILNDIASVAEIVKKHAKTYIVDAMSSFGGINIEVEKLGIDFLISSANKCIQGVPGFSFIISRRDRLEKCEGNARSLSLDLYDQWKGMDKDGKWRFTSPTHVVLAFEKALEELEAEGGVAARYKRYSENNRMLIEGMRQLGFKTYLEDNQSPIITTFYYPNSKKYSFNEMYQYIKERGYAIYPGKVTDADAFRIGNIGEIYKEDIEKICRIFSDYISEVLV